MPKKIFAVTNIKNGPEADQFFPAGSEVDGTKFSKETLISLHDAGAIEVRVVDEEMAESNPSVEDADSGEGQPGDVNPGSGTEPGQEQ